MTKTPASKRKNPGYSADFAAFGSAAESMADDRFDVAMNIVSTKPSVLAPEGADTGKEGGAVLALTHAGALDLRTLVVGRTYEIPISLIDPNPYSPRFFYRTSRIDETAVSLQEDGQKVAVNGYLKDNGRIGLIDGGTRLRAAKASGAEKLEVKIEEAPKDEFDLYSRAVAFHEKRSDHTALDTAMMMKKLLDDGVVASQDELAGKLEVNGGKLSKQTVSLYMRIAKFIPERLLRMMADHESTSALRTAAAISSIFSNDGCKNSPDEFEKMAEDVILEVIAKGLTVKEAEHLVASKLTGPKQRQHADNKTDVTLGGAKGAIKMFASRGQLDFSIKGLDEVQLNSLKGMIEDICSGRLPLRAPTAG